MTSTPTDSSCPTPTAHKRLREAHLFWHECVEDYHDPDRFIAKLNACIQALRNVTFALQNHKPSIPNFDLWYSSWQDEMKIDSVMRWLNEARIEIVHKADLDTQSVFDITLIAGYPDAADALERSLAGYLGVSVEVREPDDFYNSYAKMSSPPFVEIDDIIERIRSSSLPKRIIKQATLVLERRWIDVRAPETDVLSLLAHAHGFLTRIIADAHSKAGTGFERLDLHGQSVAINSLAEIRAYPCMATTHADRSLEVYVRDGSVVENPVFDEMKYDAELARVAEARYKPGNLPAVFSNYALSPHLLARHYANQAIGVLRNGEEHLWMVFFFRGSKRISGRVLMAQDAAHKRSLANEVAAFVAVNGIDGVVQIGEVWTAPLTLDAEGAPIPAGEHQKRGEAIHVSAETADGRRTSIAVPFRRRKHSSPVISDVIEDYVTQDNFLEPTRMVWRRLADAAS